VCRHQLLDDMVRKLHKSTTDLNSIGISLTVTGAGGYGKTSLVTALCHHPVIKENFTDGVVFIELGPQATDPTIKLSQLYHLLTGHNIKQGDINYAEQEIKKLTNLYCRNLLVIIDDVWHIEDAEPIVKAFSNCKIVLTTRMNDIKQYIPTKKEVSVGPMEQSEAISLLTCGVIDISQISEEDVSLLDELAQDVHLWPLLLSLIRGQFAHNLKRHKLSYHKAIQFVQSNLHDKGLTAFDKNNIERSRKYAVKVCIEVTLELLTQPVSDKMKSLILWTGIGTSVQTAVLQNLWNTAEHEALNVVDTLWAYGLVQYTDILIPPQNITQHCVEVHAVISQYMVESMDSTEVWTLGPLDGLCTYRSVGKALYEQFYESYGIHSVYDAASLSGKDYLEYKLSEIESLQLPYNLKHVNMLTITEPHYTIVTLQTIQNATMASPNITTFFPLLNDKIKSLIGDCHKILKSTHRLSRKLNQNVQRCLTQRSYQGLTQTIEAYIENYPMGLVAKKAVTLVQKIMPYCDERTLDCIMIRYESLQMLTPDYHYITLMELPIIKSCTKALNLIYTSMQIGSPDVEATQQYLLSGQFDEEARSVITNYYMKLQDVAPLFVQKHFNN